MAQGMSRKLSRFVKRMGQVVVVPLERSEFEKAVEKAGGTFASRQPLPKRPSHKR